jgi:hypothetical protein
MTDQESAVHYHVRGRRLWAGAALVVAIATFLFAIDVTLQRIPRGFTVVVRVIVAVAAAGFGLVRRGLVRTVALVLAVLLLAAAVTLVFVEHDPTDDVLVVAGVVATLLAARYAFRVRVGWPTAHPPTHPVLFYNPLSGGGKAERFRLADEARRRGIEPIKLRQGDDLERLVRDAVRRGADGLAMAGGDGPQAIVAMVAAEGGLPYVPRAGARRLSPQTPHTRRAPVRLPLSRLGRGASSPMPRHGPAWGQSGNRRRLLGFDPSSRTG